MIDFKKFELDNGLKIIFNKDETTPVVSLNILYNVGAKDENPKQTGLAHLFEHLMFTGSVNIPNYDNPLEKVGGKNNAFTNNDITNFYLTVPKQNIETAFWLESDRMNQLAFSQKKLDIQKNVVIEEFKETCLNQPYGDIWLLLRPLAYKIHPYQWATIGKKISHIQSVDMQDAKAFFKKYYCPDNAIMTITGNLEFEYVKNLSEKWFGPIKKGGNNKKNIPAEPKQTKARRLAVESDVPFDAIYKAYKMCNRTDKKFYTTDLISDILSNGRSSRLYKQLVKKQKLFSDIDAYHLGSIDKGLFVISGKIIKGVKIEKAEESVNKELDKIKQNFVKEQELNKVKNKIESTLIFSEINGTNRAMNLAFAELIDDASLVNKEIDNYRKVTLKQIKEQANLLFNETNCSTLYYLAKK